MCQDNLGKCGCGCKSCSTKTTTTTAPALVPVVQMDSGYSKKSDYVTSVQSSGSGYSKKTEEVAPKVTILKPRTKQPEILTPVVEVIPNDDDNNLSLWGSIALGVGLVLFGAAVKSRK